MPTKTKDFIGRNECSRFRYLIASTFFLALTVMWFSDVWAQQREEIAERKSESIELENAQGELIGKEKKSYKLLSTIGLSGSYESNPRLTAIRKGDSSGHLKYSLLYKKPLFRGVLFNFDYNVDGSGYAELNELTNLLNHTRMSLDKSFNKFLSFGIGYDFSSFYYPMERANDFYFHKGFFYVKHNISKRIFHQVMVGEGIKNYIHSQAFKYSTTTFQEVDRRDYRHELEHSLGLLLTEKLSFRFKTKYSINDSNAFFQDYHDYKSFDYSPSLNYKISEKYSFNLSLTISDKDYKNRLVGSRSDKRHDDSYNGRLGLRYDINKNNTFNLSYGYTESRSNDPTTEYTNSSFIGGWLYKF